MKRLFLVVGAALVLGACSAPGAPQKQQAVSGGCADRVAAALVSPQAPVPGSFACLNADLRERLSASVQASGDAALQKIAASDPVLTSISSYGRTGDGGYFYVQEGTDQGKPVSNILLLYLDASGHVAVVKWASQ